MSDENGGGKEKPGVLGKVQDNAAALRDTLKEKAKEQAVGLKEPEKTQLYRSAHCGRTHLAIPVYSRPLSTDDGTSPFRYHLP